MKRLDGIHGRSAGDEVSRCEPCSSPNMRIGCNEDDIAACCNGTIFLFAICVKCLVVMLFRSLSQPGYLNPQVCLVVWLRRAAVNYC